MTLSLYECKTSVLTSVSDINNASDVRFRDFIRS
jgi:hypothetical protein